METNPRVRAAADAMYAAKDAIPPKPNKDASDDEWDVYLAARTAFDVAESAYYDAYQNKMSALPIRRA